MSILETQKLTQYSTISEWIKEKDSREQVSKQVNINGNHGVFLQMILMKNRIIQSK